MLEKMYKQLLFEFRYKLGRELSQKELDFIAWINERQFEENYKRMKSS
ncbi:hypothetical protein [Bacillus sp. FJAT-45350]|nr:hypothetical protein [Bacillus sp. FJAT-45350]